MIAIVGRKHSGKTTLTVRLGAELHRRGHRVMPITHGTHTFNIDPSTTDTYRHYHEGLAERVAMISPDKFALVERSSIELGPEEIAERHMSDADVVICEGFKASTLLRIEIHRQSAHPLPLYTSDAAEACRYLAIVTDDASLRAHVPVIDLTGASWLAEVTALVETDVIGPAR
ncbi:MAG: molybdopterin-guanine dinucleotide biosynthesis protein B [Gemmatimonadaceae bacterium]